MSLLALLDDHLIHKLFCIISLCATTASKGQSTTAGALNLCAAAAADCILPLLLPAALAAPTVGEVADLVVADAFCVLLPLLCLLLGLLVIFVAECCVAALLALAACHALLLPLPLAAAAAA
jgi:hypothetical protein